MAQYAKILIRTRSEKAPDWGLGQGVIASQLAKLDDDDQMAGIQMMNMGEDLIKENIKIDFEEISKEDWDNSEVDEPWVDTSKSEQDILISFLEMLHPEECKNELSYSLEEQTQGDIIWYNEYYGIPDIYDWEGQFVRGIGQWENKIFLFDKNNKYIGITRKITNKYTFDPIELKYVIGPENYKKYFKK